MIESIKKEILEIKNDKTLLAIVLLFPIFVTFFMGGSFNKLGINGLPIGIIGKTETNFTKTVLAGLDESEAFNTIEFSSLENATDALENGKIKAIIEIPQDFENSINRGNGSKIKITLDNSDLAVEQSILAVLSSLIQASSTEITKEYVNGAWTDLEELNNSAQNALTNINSGKERLNRTFNELQNIEVEINSIQINQMQNSINNAQNSIANLKSFSNSSRETLLTQKENNRIFLNSTKEFVINATGAVDQSIDLITNTTDRLRSQINSLNNSYLALDATYNSAVLLRGQIQNSSCAVLTPTVDLLAISLNSMRNTTLNQINDANAQLNEMRNLNTTLQNSKMQLINYSERIDRAINESNNSAIEDGLNRLDLEIGTINQTLETSKTQIDRIEALIGSMKNTINQSKMTLNEAIQGSNNMASLVNQISEIVRVQTSKDPTKIASPISIELLDKYQRKGFSDFIFPQIISVTILFSALLVGAIGLVRERSRNTLTRLAIAPGGIVNLVLGKITLISLISLIQVGLIISIGVGFFEVSVPPRLDGVILGAIISGILVATIGIIIGFISKTESSAIQISLLIAIPMLFLGNIIFSSDLLPKVTQMIQAFVPLSHITNVFRISMISGADPQIAIATLIGFEVFFGFILALIISREGEK